MAEPSIELLLVGPRVSHLQAHFEQRGFRCEAFPEGGAGMSALEAKRRDVVLLEVNLGDQTAAEFVERARASEPGAVFLLLEDPSRAGQIVKALQAGVMRYLTTPPDEARLFAEVERLAIVSRALSGLLFEDKERELRVAREAERRAKDEAGEAAMQGDLVAQELSELKREVQKLRERPTQEALATLAEELEGARAEAQKSAERVQDLEEALGDGQKQAGRLASEGAALTRRADELRAERQALEERTVDLELQLDDAQTKVAFMEEQVQAAQRRAAEIEARLKKDRLRLIEDKEHAAAGSHEAWQKMERMAGEVQAAKAARAEAERRLVELERRLEVEAEEP